MHVTDSDPGGARQCHFPVGKARKSTGTTKKAHWALLLYQPLYVCCDGGQVL